jgi:hypothetical protein
MLTKDCANNRPVNAIMDTPGIPQQDPMCEQMKTTGCSSVEPVLQPTYQQKKAQVAFDVR